MQRNVVEMLEDIDLILDRTRSPRFEITDKVRALNMAQDKVINDRYDNVKREKRYSFQTYERIRSELRTIVAHKAVATVASEVVAFPADFLYLLGLHPTIDSVEVTADPMTYDEDVIIQNDPFDKPTKEIPRYLESNAGIKVYHDGTTFTAAKISYLQIPTVMYMGETSYSTPTAFVNGQVLYVDAGTVTYNLIDYTVGDTFTIATATGLLLQIVFFQASYTMKFVQSLLLYCQGTLKITIRKV
jgi:hypothetical protein